MKNGLEGEQDHEAHREAEETHGFRQGESQNGVGEQLTLERGVTGVADDQGAEHVSDTWKSLSLISFILFYPIPHKILNVLMQNL